MKFRPAHAIVVTVLLASGALIGQSSSSDRSSDEDAAIPADFYILPPKLAEWFRQPDETPVNVSDLVKVTAATRDFYNKVLAVDGGAGTTITDLVSGNYTLPQPSAGTFDSTVVSAGGTFVEQAIANQALASTNENGDTSSDSSDAAVATSQAVDAPANFGLLQEVARPFYDRLMAAGDAAQAGFIAKGLGGNTSAGYALPQPPPGPDDVNYDAVAYSLWLQQSAATITLGQVKQVFTFDSGQFTSQVVYGGSGLGARGAKGSKKGGDDVPNASNRANGSNVLGGSGGKKEGDGGDNDLARAQIALVVLTPME